MNNSRKLELVGLLAIFGATLALVGVGMQSRSGKADDATLADHAMRSPLILEAQASPVEKPVERKTSANPDNTDAPIYLDLGAKYSDGHNATGTATQTSQAEATLSARHE